MCFSKEVFRCLCALNIFNSCRANHTEQRLIPPRRNTCLKKKTHTLAHTLNGSYSISGWCVQSVKMQAGKGDGSTFKSMCPFDLPKKVAQSEMK